MSSAAQKPAVPAPSTIQTILSKVSAVASLLQSNFAQNATVSVNNGGIMGAIPTIASVAGGILTIVDPELSIAGFAATKIIALAGSIAANAGPAVSAVQAVQAAIDGGAAPTPEQWAAMDAAADEAHARLQAAAAAFLSAHQTG